MKTTLLAFLFIIIFSGCSSNTVSLPKGSDTETIYRLAQEQQSLREFHQAAKLYRQAANKGHAGAQYSLGYMYSKAWGVNHDRAKAIHWYRKAAAQNNADAQYSLGVVYDKGYGVKQDYSQAMNWYLKAAKQNHKKALNNIGFMYSQGLGVPANKNEAKKWYNKAANQGSSTARNNLKNTRNTQAIVSSTPNNTKKGEAYYKLGSEEWYKGTTKKALVWYKKAANAGHHIANADIGRIYEEGRGNVAQNYSLASKYYLQGATRGDRSSQYDIGRMYRDGKGVKKDYRRALNWFLRAASGNDVLSADAENAIGLMYAKGLGVRKDLNKAENWFLQSYNHLWSDKTKEYLQAIQKMKQNPSLNLL